MVAVKFGESEEEYHLLLDSAASNTWVMGEGCKSAACGTHNTFGPADSGTLKVQDTTFSIIYGTGSVSGILATDTLHISTLTSTLSFGLATNVSDEFRSYPMDGILGIGRGDTSPGTIESPQVMDVLKTSNAIGAKLYGIHLSRAKDGLNDGELNLGEPNTERYDGDLNFLKTVPNTNGFWEIEVEDAGVEGSMLGVSGRTAILDSGTSFILMPELDAVALHKLIPGYTQNGETFTIPCTTKTALVLAFNSQKYTILPTDYIGGTVSNGNCGSNIIGRRTFGEKQWLVGDVFLKNVYSVFDFENSQVGLGTKGTGGKSENKSSASVSATTSVASATASTAGESSSPISISTPTPTLSLSPSSGTLSQPQPQTLSNGPSSNEPTPPESSTVPSASAASDPSPSSSGPAPNPTSAEAVESSRPSASPTGAAAISTSISGSSLALCLALGVLAIYM
ncbi:acid protease [Amniculicola lignicola CBS 123094]|uniref:Acid protease n=1 Tax=Amniculicola lignicola CBS 123094 TaxID=1392246 RepID=A0A6A5WNU9_9PLEO|nr:acid protease [Amniculicola lignicola CBS 123094]